MGENRAEAELRYYELMTKRLANRLVDGVRARLCDDDQLAGVDVVEAAAALLIAVEDSIDAVGLA